MNTQTKSALTGALAVACLGLAVVPAFCGLSPGEYACAGSGGRILIGLGFRLLGDGTYTDLDGRTSGHVVHEGSRVRFVGGHLDGQVGRDIAGGRNFNIGRISCSRN